MKEKKIKRINVRISIGDYLTLKKDFSLTKKLTPKKHKTFSDYIRYLLVIGFNEYYQKGVENERIKKH